MEVGTEGRERERDGDVSVSQPPVFFLFLGGVTI